MRLGIDIGGTNISFGVVNDAQEIVWRSQVATNSFATINEALNAIKDAVATHCGTKDITGVGIGAPMLESKTGMMNGAANIHWEQPLAVQAIASTIFEEVPVCVENDANIAVLGEWKYGKAKGCEHVLMITLGTGIGGALILNGAVFSGQRGYAGEIGHMIYEKNGRPCKCGRNGCFEKYIAASGIIETFHEFKPRYPNSILSKKGDAITAADIYHAAKQADALAVAVYEHTSGILALLMANAVCCYDPEMIVLYGGVTQAKDVLLPATQRHFEALLLSVFKNKIPVVVSDINASDMGILGAAVLVL